MKTFRFDTDDVESLDCCAAGNLQDVCWAWDCGACSAGCDVSPQSNTSVLRPGTLRVRRG